jgi:hypothetical protein
MDSQQQKPTRAAVWLSYAGIAFILVPFFFMVVAEKSSLLFRGELGPLFVKDFPVLVGLPVAAVGAFVIVTFLRQGEAPIEFEGLGFKLRGAAGQVVLWLLCFIVFAVSIKLLWQQL